MKKINGLPDFSKNVSKKSKGAKLKPIITFLGNQM